MDHLGPSLPPLAWAGFEQPDATAPEGAVARRWWDANAQEYLDEHRRDLGDADFIWGPEGLRESEAELLGSLPLAAVLLGGFTLLIALLTYQLAVRDAIARLRERWEVVYEVMRTVHDGYRRVSGFLHRLLW